MTSVLICAWWRIYFSGETQNAGPRTHPNFPISLFHLPALNNFLTNSSLLFITPNHNLQKGSHHDVAGNFSGNLYRRSGFSDLRSLPMDFRGQASRHRPQTSRPSRSGTNPNASAAPPIPGPSRPANPRPPTKSPRSPIHPLPPKTSLGQHTRVREGRVFGRANLVIVRKWGAAMLRPYEKNPRAQTSTMKEGYFFSRSKQSLQMPPTSVRDTVTRISQSRAICSFNCS